MTSTLTIDKAGRIVLPKPLRDELQLEAGDSLEVNTKGEEITLRPIRGNSPLKKKSGVWVFQAGQPLGEEAVDKTIREVRRDREELILGKKR
ncbi:MAG: AbrB/MazE/SpoVT family DNA-binding domain-containing protein [Candidatus Acidiferrales bacterium]